MTLSDEDVEALLAVADEYCESHGPAFGATDLISRLSAALRSEREGKRALWKALAVFVPMAECALDEADDGDVCVRVSVPTVINGFHGQVCAFDEEIAVSDLIAAVEAYEGKLRDEDQNPTMAGGWRVSDERLHEADQLAALARLFEMAHAKGDNTLIFAPDALVDYAAAIRMVLANRPLPPGEGKGG